MPEILAEFDRNIQNIGPLREAAYRLIGVASVSFETTADRYICRLAPSDAAAARGFSEQRLHQHFIDLVTDENLREKVSSETAALRNVILALAFGSLAEQQGSEHNP